MRELLRRCLLAICGLVFSTHVLADMPSMERTKREKTYAFGDTRVRQSFNSMKDPMSPEFKVQVYNKGRLLLQLSDASFDNFYPSADGGAFVGLSNSGWPGTAAIIFDRDGRILLLAHHGNAKFDYCRQTSTFLKEWYDPADPQVRFPAYARGEGRKTGITFKDCHGKTVDLLDVISKANAQGTLRDEINMRHGTR